MLFYVAEIFRFSKNINSVGPFPDPLPIPLLYIVCEETNIDNGGVPVRGRESKVSESKRQMSLIKLNIIFM